MKNKILKSSFFLLILFLFSFFGLAKSASAATYYVSPSGSGATCLTDSRCSLATGLGKIIGGDTLILGDGTYTTKIDNLPSGSAGAYTTVRAENDWGVTINGSGWANAYNNGLTITGVSYIQVQGIKFRMSQTKNTNVPIVIGGPNWTPTTHHIKLIRCAAMYGPITNNAASVSVSNADYVLVEECYSFGGARYQFQAFWSDHVIFRRNIARIDRWNDSLQCAVFNNYDAKNTVWQNNIAIDTPASNCPSGLYGAFFFENKLNTASEIADGAAKDTSQIIYGNIALNVESDTYADGFSDGKISGTHTFDNNIIWGANSGFNGGTEYNAGEPAANLIITNMTSGAHTGTYSGGNGEEAAGVGVTVPQNIANSVRNSLFYNNHSFGIADYVASDWNAFFGNTANAGGSRRTPAIGTNSKTNLNPGTNGLLYLPRIEAGSTACAGAPCSLKTAGVGGAQIGAEVVYQMGAAGTLYGEAGWNDLTSTPLWPFPNESVIKADMGSYAGGGASGARGFATGTSKDGSPQTLTKYIWEYLGNQIPAEIYGASGDTTAPSAPTGLSIQ